MAMALDPNEAFELAIQLTTIPDCPRTEMAVDALGMDLIKLCRNSEEAQWVVQEARWNWEKWKGTAGLRALLQEKHEPACLPLERQVIDLGPKPVVTCAVCHDFGWFYGGASGHQFCVCAAGRQAQAEMPDMIDKLNAKHFRSIQKITRAERKPVTEEDLERAFQARQDRSEEMIAAARATLADPEASKNRKEIAREILRGCGVEEAS